MVVKKKGKSSYYLLSVIFLLHLILSNLVVELFWCICFPILFKFISKFNTVNINFDLKISSNKIIDKLDKSNKFIDTILQIAPSKTLKKGVVSLEGAIQPEWIVNNAYRKPHTASIGRWK